MDRPGPFLRLPKIEPERRKISSAPSLGRYSFHTAGSLLCKLAETTCSDYGEIGVVANLFGLPEVALAARLCEAASMRGFYNDLRKFSRSCVSELESCKKRRITPLASDAGN